MVEIQKHKNEVGSRVRLKGDGQDSIYPAAYAGAEGWVRERDHDPHGFPRVFIVWDKTHWTYNGEQDGWTFDDHFDTIEGPKMNEDKSGPPPGEAVGPTADPRMIEMLKHYANALGLDLVPKSEDEAKAYGKKRFDETIIAAQEDMIGSRAFLTIVVKEQEDSENVDKMLVCKVYSDALEEVAEIVLEGQLSELVFGGYRGFLHDALQEAMNESRRSSAED